MTASASPKPALPLQRMLAPLAFLLAGLLSVLVAWGAAVAIEYLSQRSVNARLAAEGMDWASATPDGMLVYLHGTAPTEAARFRLVKVVGSMIDSSRIRDRTDVTPDRALEAPRFSIEMLRNDDGIQLVGLLPSGSSAQVLSTAAKALAGDAMPVSDMLETSAFAAPEGWQPAFDFGISALKLLPRSKISVSAEGVAVTAIAGSDTEKRNLETRLAQEKPRGLAVRVTISAPRPVLTPFTLRFVKDAQGARFDACSADTEAARNRILAAAAAAGADGRATCVIGLGVPSPSWASAVEAGIQAVAALGAGTITFSDADVSLLAAVDTPQASFDRAVGDLQAALPDVFSLNAQLPKKPDAAAAGPAEFTAVLTGEGKVELRGRLADDMQRRAVDSFAKAAFGSAKVLTATRLDPDLPQGWPVRVLAGLQALSVLHEGKLVVRADTVEIQGVTGAQQGKARISQILSGKLGQGRPFKVDVRYDEAFDPLAALPTPQECIDRVNTAMGKQKITFQPGSAEIDGSAAGVMNAIADALKDCKALPMEIQGHTDAQGSDEGNRALSQARAEAVLVALQGRRVDVSEMTAKGYGEARPIADNATEDGRDANRRIEFHLIGDQTGPQGGAVAAVDGPVIRGTVVTAPDAPADSQACVYKVRDLLTKQKIGFEPGKSQITPASQGLITAIATLLKQCPGAPVEVSGHTDSQGSPEGNKTLSQDRAKAVLDALAGEGVDVSAMTAVGYGEDLPIADNGTDEGREANRRIEFTLTGTDADQGATDDTGSGDGEPGATAADAAGGDPATSGPDFSADTSPSIAPKQKTKRPKPRPVLN